jgi:heme-degrading monooxygenase HmoA
MRNGPIAAIALATLCFASAAAERDTPAPAQAAIARVWHGKVALARAAEYERYIAPQLKAFRKIPGNRGYTLLKEARGDEMHFLVISYWDSRSAIRAYAGEGHHESARAAARPGVLARSGRDGDELRGRTQGL